MDVVCRRMEGGLADGFAGRYASGVLEAAVGAAYGLTPGEDTVRRWMVAG